MPVVGRAFSLVVNFQNPDGTSRYDFDPETGFDAVRVWKDGALVFESTFADPLPGLEQVNQWYEFPVSAEDSDADVMWVLYAAPHNTDDTVMPVEQYDLVRVDPAPASVTVEEIVAALGGGTIVYVPSVVLKNGDIGELVSGDAYTRENGRALRWKIPDNLTPDPATADTRILRIRTRGGTMTINDVAVDVVTIAGERYFEAELSRTESRKIRNPGDGQYDGEIECSWFDGDGNHTADSPVTPVFFIVKKTFVFDNT